MKPPVNKEVRFSKGVEIRAEIDRDTVRALIVLNGGGAVALLALLPAILKVPGYVTLAEAILAGVVFLTVGLLLTVVHNVYRRECSRLHEKSNWSSSAGQSPACRRSRATRFAALSCFVLAVFLVAGVGLWVLHETPAKLNQGTPPSSSSSSQKP